MPSSVTATCQPLSRLAFVTLVLTVSTSMGCGGMRPTTFINPEYNFAYIERVAVVPLENLTTDQAAGARATRYFVNELLATEAFEVVEPGEVARVLSAHGILRTAELTKEQAIQIGSQLAVQGLFLGSIAESAETRNGSSTARTVTMSVRLLETDTGETVWSTTHTEGGRSFWSRLFGTGNDPLSEVTRRCVAKTIATLVD